MFASGSAPASGPTARPTARPLGYWLLKSEPSAFSFADLCQVSAEPWNGVRNYQARNFLRQMQVGDLCLFYHSNAKPTGVAGVARVVRAAYPDDLQFDPSSPYFDPRSDPTAPRWSMVDVQAVAALPRLVSLAELRALPQWSTSPLTAVRSRLSVMPVSAAQFEVVLELGGLELAICAATWATAR